MKYVYITMEGFVNTGEKSPFEYGLKYSRGYSNYGVDKSYIKRENEQNTSIPSDKSSKAITCANIDKTIVDTMTSDDKSGRHRFNSALITGGSIAVLGAAALTITKGHIPKAVSDAMGHLIENVSEKADAIKQKPAFSRFEGFYYLGLQGIKRYAYMARGAVFNMSPLKDVLFDKFLRKKCGLKKTCDVITNAFGKLSFSTVKSTYKKASQDVDNMTTIFTDVNKRIESGKYSTSLSKSETDLLKQKTMNIKTSFNDSFGDEALQARSNILQEKFSGLSDKVYNRIYGNMKDFLKNVSEWTTFVPEDIVAKDKAELMELLAEKRKIITNNPLDNYKNMSSILAKMENIIKPDNKESREILQRLRKLSKEYSELSGSNEQQMRLALNKEMASTLKKAENISKSQTYTPESSKKLFTAIQEFGNIIKNDKKGNVEEILSIYKKILPEEEYREVKKAAQKAAKSLKAATYEEGYEYVDKVRDLATGSALTDTILGLAVPVVTTCAALSAADTDEKKRSVLFKYGIPLLVGAATTTLCTVRLISGGKSLIFGTLAGTLTNVACEHVDDCLKQNEKKK